MSRKSSLFTSVPTPRVNRNLFDLSHEVKMSCKFGFLYPVLLMDTLPGDVVREQMTAMVRFAPMLSPVMHRVDVSVHYFFVPNRLLSDHWEDFITGGQDGLNATVLPFVTPLGIDTELGADTVMRKRSLWDYFGLPVLEGAGPATFDNGPISVLPFRAYAKIWNDFYRDPNFDAELELNLEQAGNVDANTAIAQLYTMRRRGWEKDYFTSALPWAQRGAEVLMPLGGTGSVTYLPQSNIYENDGDPAAAGALSAVSVGLESRLRSAGAAGTDLRIQNIDEVTFDSSDISINDLRRALAIQRWLENNARGGGRYIEQIQSHFNQRVPDFRLQRAEYLGGGKQPVVISEVLATASSEGDGVVVGDMAGHGISVGKSNRFTYKCQEHGFILGIMSVMPRTAYEQGMDRLWSRVSRYDFAWPELAHLGEQEILNKEVFFSFDDGNTNDGVFGYIPRYSEYKFKNDRVAGDFRDTLAFWHLGRIFTAQPALDENFTTMDESGLESEEESYRRIFAVSDGTDYLWCQLFHRLTAKRPLPYFGVPSIM